MKRLAWIILLTYVLAVSLHYHLHKTYRHQSSLFTQMLYLPTAKYLKPVSFGYYALLADFIYLWSIQYYGDPEFSPRMEYLKHTYEIITELDPHYLDAYQTGALFMFYEGRNPQAGLDLLNKGMEKNPNEWIIPADAGFFCMMNLGNNRLAVQYFKRAASIPKSPSQIKRLLAGMHFRSGDRVHAYLLWKEIYETATKASIKQTAYQHVHDLKILMDLEGLRKAIAEFQSVHQRAPLNLQQLVSSGLIQEIPSDPDGDGYLYEPRTGEVKYSKELGIYKRYQ